MDLRTDPMTVIPEDFPELALLVWSRDPSRPLPADEAFALYENNWRHVDVERLTAEEAALIECLKGDYGNGFLLTAAESDCVDFSADILIARARGMAWAS